MGSKPVEEQRLIQIADAPGMPGLHMIQLKHSLNYHTEMYLTTVELHDLVNKGVKRLYEIGDLEWVVA